MRITLVTAALLIATALSNSQAQEPKRLLRSPSVSATKIVFSWAGDLWTTSREGGDAVRLTTGDGEETGPSFSPDGSQIAFTGEYEGNADVYVVSTSGGVPKRITYRAGWDEVLGWTPDGKNILFNSGRESAVDYLRIYTIPVAGGMPSRLPLPMAAEGSLSPDGKSLAYVPHIQWQQAWKRYRGGQTRPIWIANLADSSVVKVPRQNSNDFNPMWVGNSIYFLSDRNGPVTLFSYDVQSKRVSETVKNAGLDLKAASAGPGAIAYEQFGEIYLYDLAAKSAKRVPIRITGDLAEVRPKFIKASSFLEGARLSPTGARAVIEARGDIITVPADKGDERNLTQSSGIAERDPAWSPNGKWIAYFSDESGSYALHVRSHDGKGETNKIDLGPPSFFYRPTWSPDSKKIAYMDKRLTLWYVDLEKKQPVKVDFGRYNLSEFTGVAWSPDSKWLTYEKMMRSHQNAVFLYSLETSKATQVTDGMSDAKSPVFDKSGKYLYFVASTDVALTVMGLDMSSNRHPVTYSPYLCVLRNDLPSPLLPESDEEKVKEEKPKEEKPAEAAKTDAKPEDMGLRIDLDRIGQRILALPMPARNYQGVVAGKEGIVFFTEGPLVDMTQAPPMMTVTKFDLSSRKAAPVISGVRSFSVSADGEKALYGTPGSLGIASAAGPIAPGTGALKLDSIEIRVDPRQEWRQMYREAWRLQRDFFYAENFHGLDLAAAEIKYQPWLDGLSTRSDLTYLFEEMLGDLTVGHMFIRGGDGRTAQSNRGGMLGADFEVDAGKLKFTRVYDGENWNPGMRAPLTQPGVNVKAGEYLLQIDGRDVPPTEQSYELLEGKAGKQVVLKVGPNPNGDRSREVTVVPVPVENGLRYLAWIEDNRRMVDQLSSGRIAYVHVPDTGLGGFTSFNRYYFAQVGREGAIIDERFNHGGQLADYIIDVLKRPIMSLSASREGDDLPSPTAAIFGPKTMIVNEMAGSGGDALPWYFRKANLGTIVGKRTWGGLVGIGGYPNLIDGGMVTAPRFGIYGLNGEWEVENVGTPPDIEVEYEPALWRLGRDAQLEKAVQVTLEAMKKNPPKEFKRPAFPNYQKRP